MKFSTIFVVLAVVLTGFCGLVGYGIINAPQIMARSNATLDDFYRHSQSHDYAGARKLFSRQLQKQMSAQTLAQQWKAFETAHGATKSWAQARGTTRFIILCPRYVTDKQTVSGRKGSSGLVTTRMVPEGKNWRIDQITITP